MFLLELGPSLPMGGSGFVKTTVCQEAVATDSSIDLLSAWLPNLPTSWWLTVLVLFLWVILPWYLASGDCVVFVHLIAVPSCTWSQGCLRRGPGQDSKGHARHIVECGIRPPKMAAVLLLSIHPLLDQSLLHHTYLPHDWPSYVLPPAPSSVFQPCLKSPPDDS